MGTVKGAETSALKNAATTRKTVSVCIAIRFDCMELLSFLGVTDVFSFFFYCLIESLLSRESFVSIEWVY